MTASLLNSVQITGADRPSPGRAIAEGAADFALISSRHEFDALGDEWTSLFQRAGRGRHLFQSHNWLWHWANAFLAGEEASGNHLAIVTGRVDGKLALVWPTLLKTSGPIRKLVWMGGPVSAYGDILLDDIPGADHLLAESVNFIRAKSGASLLYLTNVASDARVAAPMLSDGAERRGRGEAKSLVAASLNSCRDVPALASHRSRRMHARKRLRFLLAGGGELACVTGGEDAATLARMALRQTHMSVLGSLEDAAAAARIEAFYADVAAARQKPVGCEISTLTLDGTPVAIALGFRAKDEVFQHIISCAPEARKYSVASLLMEDLVSTLCLKEGVSIDHVTSDTPFTARWSTSSNAVFDVVRPLSALGLVYVKLYGGIIYHVARRTYQNERVSALLRSQHAGHSSGISLP